jgi:hypothetical protein
LDHLIVVLSPFYDGYNVRHVHGSVAYLWPELVEQAWHSGLVHWTADGRGRVRFKLLVLYQELLTGCRSLK